MKFNEFDEKIMIKNTDGVYELVERYSIDSAKEGLDIFISPNGAMDMQLEKILKKVNIWSDQVHASFFNKKESYIGANTTILKRLSTYCQEHCSHSVYVSLYNAHCIDI